MRMFFLTSALALSGCLSTSQSALPDPKSEHDAAIARLKAGRPAAGIDLLEDAVHRNPHYAPNYLALAAAWSHYRHADLVVANLRTFLELQPEHHQARLYLGEVLFDEGKREEAKGHFEAYLACANGDDARTRIHRNHAAARLAEIAAGAGDSWSACYFAALREYEAALVQAASLQGSQGEPAGAAREAAQHLAASMEELHCARAFADSLETVESAEKLVAQALKDVDAGVPPSPQNWPGLLECPCRRSAAASRLTAGGRY
jgi:Tfp pilus assembly protein PilF